MIPAWVVWLCFAVTGVVAALLTNAVLSGNGLMSALYSPVLIAYVVIDIGVAAVFLDER